MPHSPERPFRPRPYRPTPPPAALRPKRALLFVLLALIGLWLGWELARLGQERVAPPPSPPEPSLAWEDGRVVVRPPAAEEERVD